MGKRIYFLKDKIINILFKEKFIFGIYLKELTRE